MNPSQVLFTLALVFTAPTSFAQPNIPLEKGVEPPALLSQTGLFAGDVANLQPSAGLRAYSIIQPLWVDFAQKQRFLYLPAGTSIQFSPNEAWGFPVGTILVKHFRMETSRGVFQNIETRLLVRQNGEATQSWVGFTYQWDGADAHLVDARANPSVLLTVDSTAPGGNRVQTFKIPSRNQCLQCHNSSVGYVRSVTTEQLNRDVNGVNQLESLNQLKVFDRDIGPPQALGSFANIADETQPLEKRVKSYLAVNCSHCHNPDPAALCSYTGLDFRFASFSVDALVASGHLVKGSSAGSEIFKRMDSVIPRYRMPFIGSALKDDAALAVIGQWIDGL